MNIHLKRAYDPPEHEDGTRILVDRLWPRGMPKSKAQIDLWLKEIAPSEDLRMWFGHKPERWDDFKNRYFNEIEKHADAIARLARQAQTKPITLVYASKDERHNNAVALKEFMERT